MNSYGDDFAKQIEYLPKISIIMPSYNQAKYIERSILSILNQDYKNLELIVVDGGSTDETCEIIKKYDSSIYKWVSEIDQGQSDALNKGFSWATGDIYGWLNSDDIYLPGAFKVTVEALRKNINKKIVYGDWLSIDQDDNILDLNYAFDFNLNHFIYEGFHLNSQSMFWRSSVHNTFSGFDVELFNTMDYQMILEFGIQNGQESFLRVPVVMGGFRRYLGQKTAGFTKKVIDEHERIAQRYNTTARYGIIGFSARLYFRFRRALWYIRRGGLSELKLRLINAYFILH